MCVHLPLTIGWLNASETEKRHSAIFKCSTQHQYANANIELFYHFHRQNLSCFCRERNGEWRKYINKLVCLLCRHVWRSNNTTREPDANYLTQEFCRDCHSVKRNRYNYCIIFRDAQYIMLTYFTYFISVDSSTIQIGSFRFFIPIVWLIERQRIKWKCHWIFDIAKYHSRPMLSKYVSLRDEWYSIYGRLSVCYSNAPRIG